MKFILQFWLIKKMETVEIISDGEQSKFCQVTLFIGFDDSS